MTDFRERYETYSNDRLLHIIDNAADYQPEAVEAAKQIILERQLTDEDMKAARESLAAEQQAQIERIRELNEDKEKFKRAGRSVLEKINPIKKGDSKAYRTIKIVAIVFGVVYLKWFIGQFNMMVYMFTDIPDWDWSVAAYFLQLLYTPVAIILFYMRKKPGWVMFLVFLVIAALARLYALFLIISLVPLDIHPTRWFFVINYPAVYLLSFAFLTGAVWVICKKEIRREFF